MRANGFAWWQRRLDAATQLYDVCASTISAVWRATGASPMAARPRRRAAGSPAPAGLYRYAPRPLPRRAVHCGGSGDHHRGGAHAARDAGPRVWRCSLLPSIRAARAAISPTTWRKTASATPAPTTTTRSAAFWRAPRRRHGPISPPTAAGISRRCAPGRHGQPRPPFHRPDGGLAGSARLCPDQQPRANGKLLDLAHGADALTPELAGGYGR